jgi:hypothetical protein
MKLSEQDAQLYYRLMWRLQYYVNEQHHILDEEIDSPEEYGLLSPEDRIQVRDVLWEEPALIDRYVRANPDGLEREELTLVQSWKRMVKGPFYIYRLLKKHAIFLDTEGNVYGVVGLGDDLDVIVKRMISGLGLPAMVDTVLLPFKGQIIYDGLIRSYGLSFGGGVRSSFHEQYMTAKQNGRIITSLEEGVPKVEPRKPPAPDPTLLATLDELVKTTEKLRGGPPAQSAALTLLRASAGLAQAVVGDPADTEALWAKGRQVRTALTRLHRTLDRAER